MKRDTVNYLATGALVAVVGIVFLISLAMITGKSGPTDHYFTRFEDVSGLKYGTPVYFEGYLVGQIESIEPQREGANMRYRVEFSVKKDWPIPEDSVVQMLASGLLSAMMLDIDEGVSARPLPPGGEMKGRGGGNLFLAMNEMAGEMRSLSNEAIRPLLKQLGDGAPAIVGDVRALTQKLNASADALNRILDAKTEQQVRDTLSHADEAAKNVAVLSRDLGATREQLNRLLTNVDGLLAHNDADIRQSVQNLRQALDAVNRHIASVMQNMESASRNMNEFSHEIRKNPGALLSSTPPPDARR